MAASYKAKKRTRKRRLRAVLVLAALAILIFAVSAGTRVASLLESDSGAGITIASGKPADGSDADFAVSLLLLDKQVVYLPLGGTDSVAVLSDGDALTWTSSDTGVVRVDSNGTLTAVSGGRAVVTAKDPSGLSADCSVIVTDLFQTPRIDNAKSWVSGVRYTEEENDLLDAALAYRVDEAGYGTRAGVVAAAQFLTLEFPYTIPYFYENGRLNNHSGLLYVDGEGRYYHRGLFLHESRFEQLAANYAGPAVWGQSLYSYQTDESSPNGFSCGGFVSWSLLNGGFDVGDSGAGNFVYRDDDLCDLGEKVSITADLLASGRVKAGDLIGLDGHIAIILAIDDANIYVAESWQGSLHVDTYERYRGLLNTEYTFICLMDEVYGSDGDLTEIEL